MDLFAKKPLSTLIAEAGESGEHTLLRHLGPIQFVMLGIGAIIGAGLFVRRVALAAQGLVWCGTGLASVWEELTLINSLLPNTGRD